MKYIIKSFLLISVLFFTSCDDDFFYQDTTPPPPPTNITTITGDNMVKIEWTPVIVDDLAGYSVYYSDSYNGEYRLIGTTTNTSFIDYEALNGITTYYAISTYDLNGNESDLSYDVVYDTPRPEGFGQRIWDYKTHPQISGYDFSEYSTVAFNSNEADFFFENSGTLYLNVWADTDIQSMGRTNSIYDISEAPLDGWVELVKGENVKYVHAVRGFTYVIWTNNNHFAKIRIEKISLDYIEFDWAYQTVAGNVELKVNRENCIRGKVVVHRK